MVKSTIRQLSMQIFFTFNRVFSTMDLTSPLGVNPRALLVSPNEYNSPLLQFLLTLLKPNFKLLLMTSLRQKLIGISYSKAVSKGLKDQECKKGSHAKHPPIPYVGPPR